MLLVRETLMAPLLGADCVLVSVRVSVRACVHGDDDDKDDGGCIWAPLAAPHCHFCRLLKYVGGERVRGREGERVSE